MPRPITARDMFRVRLVSDPRISPDGAEIAYTESRLLAGADRTAWRVAVVDVADGRPVWHWPGRGAAKAARWSPDGARLALVADHGGGEAIAIVSRGTWTARIIPIDARRVAEPVWSPDGTRIAFTAESRLAAGDRSVSWYVPDVRYKTDGTAVGPGRAPRHVWILDPGDGSCRRLTAGAAHESGPAWAPSGQLVAFVSDRDRTRPASDVVGLYVAPADDPEASPRRIVDPVGAVAAVAWSPDGRALAFIGHAKGDAQGVDQEVRLVAASGGRVSSLTAAHGRSVGLVPRSDDVRGMGDARLEWTADGRWIQFRDADGGSGRIARVDRTGTVQLLASGPRTCLDFTATPDGSIVAFVASTPESPGDVHVMDVVAASERRLTDTNRWLRSVALGRTSMVETRSPDGYPLQGWITEPAGTSRAPRPMVLSIHGGPHYPTGWRWWFEAQRLAARGYVVVTGNPRGSQGYGEPHAIANRGDWGGRDYEDLLAILDEALRRPGTDPGRVAVTGVSYGGYMTLWAISRSDRFAAAICENGVSDLLSLYGTAEDGGGLWDHEFGAPPWPDTGPYLERSPLVRAGEIHTPLLLIHAELDQGCPIQQSEEMFVALRRLGRSVEFLRIPGEGHLVNLVGRPSHRLERAAAVDDWLDRHLDPAAALVRRSAEG